MRAKLLDRSDGLRTYAVVFSKDEQVRGPLEGFARDEEVTGAALQAIGAFRGATLAYFDPAEMDYREIAVDGQVEVVSLVGDIALDGDAPQLHAHVVVGRRDGSTAGGHLVDATVWPTLEVVVTETPAHLCKTVDPQTGLALIDLRR